MILDTCLVYLHYLPVSAQSLSKSDLDARCIEYPFLQYAADNWGRHISGVVGTTKALAWSYLSDNRTLQNATQIMANFQFCNYESISGMHVAAYFGLEDLVRKAFKYQKAAKDDIEACTGFGENVLHWAVTHRQHPFMTMLIEKGAEMNTRDSKGRTAVYIAVENGDPVAIGILFATSEKPDLNIAEKSRGWTPLHFAAAYGHWKMVKNLLKLGARVDAVDKYGDTALKCASDQGRVHTAELLVNSNASFELRSPSYKHWNLLVSAGRDGREGLVKLLIERHGDLEAIDTNGRTALSWAIEYDRRKIAWLLIEAGVDVNKPADKDFSAPLCQAASRGQLAMMWLLLINKAKIRGPSSDKTGMTPINIAAHEGQSSAVGLLLDMGADPLKGENTPIRFAIDGGREKTVEYLVRRENWMVHKRDLEERVALHYAASQGNIRIIELLLRHGADITAKDVSGMTALQLAVRFMPHDKQYEKVAACLKRHEDI